MMTAVFTTMLLALVFGFRRMHKLALICVAISLVISIGLFLYEVYSPEYGFRMPWIQTELDTGLSTLTARG